MDDLTYTIGVIIGDFFIELYTNSHTNIEYKTCIKENKCLILLKNME
jgi:hypothetical protein